MRSDEWCHVAFLVVFLAVAGPACVSIRRKSKYVRDRVGPGYVLLRQHGRLSRRVPWILFASRTALPSVAKPGERYLQGPGRTLYPRPRAEETARSGTLGRDSTAHPLFHGQASTDASSYFFICFFLFPSPISIHNNNCPQVVTRSQELSKLETSTQPCAFGRQGLTYSAYQSAMLS